MSRVSHAQRLERLQRQLADRPVLQIVDAPWIAAVPELRREEERLGRFLSSDEWAALVAAQSRRASSADGEARAPRRSDPEPGQSR